MEENTDKNGIETGRNPETGRFVEGNPGGGRPKGSRDFSTDFDEVVDDIAKENKITKSEVRKILLKVAYKNAKEGNYSFYKDIHDRIYGTAIQKSDITSKGETIKTNSDNLTLIAEEVANKLKEQKLDETQ